ncbi:putative extracellular SCP domain protein Pry1, partial [Aspergillus glaucus CBS 516.65]
TTTLTSTPTSPTPASYTSLKEFKDTVLSISNDYRNEHDACTLTWNDTLADYSRNWAQQCKWKHSKGPYGENLSFGYPNASSAIAIWGEERKMYNFKLPTGFTEETGHFTQLVWKATTQVGCAAVDCGYDDDDAKDEETGDFEKALGWYVVCEYAPAGNVMGKNKKWFKANVVPEKARGGGGRTGS